MDIDPDQLRAEIAALVEQLPDGADLEHQPSLAELRRLGLRYLTGDFLYHDKVVRHDQSRLARLLLDKFVKPQETSQTVGERRSSTRRRPS